MIKIKRHENYEAQAENWALCRLSMRSAREIKKGDLAIPRLLPMEIRETDSDKVVASKNRRYQFYKRPAVWCGCPKRTRNGFIGYIMREWAEIILGGAQSSPAERWLNNVDGSETHLNSWWERHVLPNVLTVGYHGVFVDQAEYTADPTPRLVGYPVEHVLNWRVEGGKLTWVALAEIYEEGSPSFGQTFDFQPTVKWRSRHLVLEDGVFRWYLYDERNQLIDQSTNHAHENTRELPFIPFEMVGHDGTGFDYSEPPLMELIELSYADLNLSALRELAHFFGASPAYIGSQINKAQLDKLGISLALGQMGIIGLPGDGDVKIIEYRGDIITHYESKEEQLRRRMIALGAAILSTEGASNIAEKTAKGLEGSERSVLTKMVENIDDGGLKTLRHVAWWFGIEPTDENVKFELNKEFWEESLTGELAGALVELRSAKLLGLEDVYRNLARVKALKKGTTEPDYIKARQREEAEQHDLEAKVAMFAADLAAQSEDDEGGDE